MPLARQQDCTGRALLLLLPWRITGDQAPELRNLVVWTRKFKVARPWEFCESLPASGFRMPFQSSLGYFLWICMKPNIPHMAKICQATEDLVRPREQGGKLLVSSSGVCL